MEKMTKKEIIEWLNDSAKPEGYCEHLFQI